MKKQLSTLIFIQDELIELAAKYPDSKPELILICGELDFEMMSNAILLISTKLKQQGVGPSVVTKTKLLATELIQNVFKHGYNKSASNAYFAVYLSDSEVYLRTGNLIDNSKVNNLEVRLNKLKQISPAEVTAMYFECLKSNMIDENDNAGLGLISMYHRSKGTVDFNIKPVNELLRYFVMEIVYPKF